MRDLIAVALKFGTKLAGGLVAFSAAGIGRTECVGRERLFFSFQKDINKAILHCM